MITACTIAAAFLSLIAAALWIGIGLMFSLRGDDRK